MYLSKHSIESDVEKLNSIKNVSNVRLLGYISDRSGRKSSAIQEYIIDKAIRGRPSVVIRNKTNRPITDKWLSDYVFEHIIQENGFLLRTEKVEEFKGAMTVTYLITDKENPKENTLILYYGMYLSVSDIYKSNYYEGWENVDDFIFEEAVPTERLIQDERHIISNSMKQMFDLLSICSTVSRGRKVNCFMLGNDISYNLLNPVTVSFDLLERLEVNKKIIDECVINDIKYTFIFLYFDFPGATNHWMKNTDKKIDGTVPVSDLSFKKYGFKTQFKKYLIFSYNNGLYISDKSPEIKNKIMSKKQLLSHLGYDDFFYSADIQIQVLLNNGTEYEKEEIQKYIDRYGKFKPQKVDSEVHYFDLMKIEKMKIHEVDTMPEGESFKALLYEIQNSKSLFSNYRIKTFLNTLYYDFEIYKKIC